MNKISVRGRRQAFTVIVYENEDDELLDALLNYCQTRNHSKSKVVLMALARFLGVSGYDVNEKKVREE